MKEVEDTTTQQCRCVSSYVSGFAIVQVAEATQCSIQQSQHSSINWQSSCECSHTWWLGTCTIHSAIHCHLQSAWPSPSSCAGSLPQRSHTALAPGSGGHSEQPAEQQSSHPEGEQAKLDCDLIYLERQCLLTNVVHRTLNDCLGP